MNVRVLLIVVAMSFAGCGAPEKPRKTQKPDVPLANITYGAFAHTDDQSVESRQHFIVP